MEKHEQSPLLHKGTLRGVPQFPALISIPRWSTFLLGSTFFFKLPSHKTITLQEILLSPLKRSLALRSVPGPLKKLELSNPLSTFHQIWGVTWSGVKFNRIVQDGLWLPTLPTSSPLTEMRCTWAFSVFWGILGETIRTCTLTHTNTHTHTLI